MSETVRKMPDGMSAIDFIASNASPVEVPVNTDTPPAAPSAGDPPSPAPASPPASPPASEPAPGSEPPFGLTQNPIITKEQALSVLYGTKYKSLEEVNTLLSLGEQREHTIAPYKNAIQKLSEEIADPEISSLSKFKKVTGIVDLGVKKLVEQASAESANALDVLLADTLLKIPTRVGKIEETRQELMSRFPDLETGSSLSISTEEALSQARQNLKAIQERVSAQPVAQVDVNGLLQQEEAKRSEIANRWASALESTIDGFATKSAGQKIPITEGFSAQIDITQMKRSISDLANGLAAQGVEPTPEVGSKILQNEFKALVFENLPSILDSYYSERKMREDREADNPPPIGRTDTPPPSPATGGYDKAKDFVFST